MYTPVFLLLFLFIYLFLLNFFFWEGGIFSIFLILALLYVYRVAAPRFGIINYLYTNKVSSLLPIPEQKFTFCQ
jgi:hypothetical protein